MRPSAKLTEFQFHNRTIPCSSFVPHGPEYGNISPYEKICATTGGAAGADFVDGDAYLTVNFNYKADHLWRYVLLPKFREEWKFGSKGTTILTGTSRNFGIMIALMIFGCAIYLLATEFISAKKSKGEILLFQRGRVPDMQSKRDEEANANDRVNTETLAQVKTVLDTPASIQKQTSIFYWSDVSLNIKIKGKPRRLLDEVDGWVRPGTLTALMV